MSRPVNRRRKVVVDVDVDTSSSRSASSTSSQSRYPLRKRKEAKVVNSDVKPKKTILKGISATSTQLPKKKPTVPICLTSSSEDDVFATEVQVAKKAPLASDLALIKDVEFVTIMKNKEQYLYYIKPLGVKHLSNMVPGVFYPESASVLEMLTEVPLDKSKLMKLSRNVFIQILTVNKIPFSLTDTRDKFFTLLDSFLKQKKNKGQQLKDACDVKSTLVTEQMLSCLSAENQAEYKEMENAKISDVKAALLKWDVTVDGDPGKEALLEKLFLLFFNGALSEKLMKKYEPRKSLMLANECCICMDKAIKSYTIPCGHISMCETCPHTVPDCPVCRVPIQQVLPAYFA